VFLAYIDDSKDRTFACFSAIVLPASEWFASERLILHFRAGLDASDGISMTKELHATDFIAGRGDLGSVVSKWRRARIFEEALTFVTTLPKVSVVNACLSRRSEDLAFARLVDRLNAFAMERDEHMLLISDQGKDYTPLLRRMRRHDVSLTGMTSEMPSIAAAREPVERIVEDIVYRDSKLSTFIQLADFCAFALLRFLNPTTKIVAASLSTAFLRLGPVVVADAIDDAAKAGGSIAWSVKNKQGRNRPTAR
jgi:hypothetical protein